jgi:purine-binding chemotaxis protein CheW
MPDSYFNANENEDLSEDSQLTQLVGFVIGKELFGVSILMVQEIIRSAPITAVPNAPDFIEGIINLRGSIVPIIDLRKRLGLYEGGNVTNEDIWILILNIEGRTTGFIVDSVTQVLKIDENTLEPPPDIVVARLESQYIRGVCKLDEDLLILLDFTCILMVDEFKKMRDVVAA